jgi:arabinogalactan endo-1,4-beta-galactosidase
MKLVLTSIFITLALCLSSQTFYRGNDLSYINQMEDCGAVYKQNGTAKDPFRIFAELGTNLVRVRLWHNPSWQSKLAQPVGVKAQYSNFDDVKKTIQRAKAEGMQVMLDIHLSDFWCDPAQQLIPAAWVAQANNPTVLADSVYNYVSKVLTRLNADGLMPEMVKIGNENNGGILRYTTLTSTWTVTGSVSTDWSRHAKMFNAGIKAVRDISQSTTIKPKIALHYSNLKNITNWYQTLINNGVTDFDVIGFSYYYSWHGYSIAEMGATIRSLRTRWPQYDVMAVETGYLWTTTNHDALGNIINTPDPQYLPVSPEKQLEYMTDYAREVKRSGGMGVIFWEPAWVSTPCKTPWGTGSSHDHVAFFEPGTNNFMENGGGKWTNPSFYNNANDKKVTFKVDASGLDVSNELYVSGSWAPGQLIKMADFGNGIYSYFTYLPQNSSGSYFFVLGNNMANRETVPATCALVNGTDRRWAITTADAKFAFKFGSCEAANEAPPFVTFRVDMTGQDVSNGVYVVGDFTSWSFVTMAHVGENIYSYTTNIAASDNMLAYYYMRNNSWTNYQTYRETVPTACASKWGTDRGIVVEKRDTVVNNVWGSCEQFLPTSITQNTQPQIDISISPNPNNGIFKITSSAGNGQTAIEIVDFQGRKVHYSKKAHGLGKYEITIPSTTKGLLLIKVQSGNTSTIQKVHVVR